MRGSRSGRWGALLVMLALPALAWLGACGTDRPDNAGDGTIPPRGSEACGTPNPGCPCDQPGEVVDCGTVEYRSGDYVTCSVGHRTCTSSGWGQCIGTNIVTKKLASVTEGGALHGLALGPAMTCPPPPSPLANPCDPYCNQFVDDPTGVVLGGGLTVSGGGITVVGGGGATPCQVPQDWTAYYGQYPAGARPNGALPTTCVAGPPSNCANDLKCVAGACTSRAVSESGSCAGPDFTLGTPCWDGSRMTFQVCNRGTVAATSGILPIAHHTGSASPAASTCMIAANGPAGDCTIDLAAKPLQPGQCVQFTPTADCPLSVPNDSGDQFYFVNKSNTGLAVIPGECNTCNNFTATKDTAKPPGVPGAACQAISCGGPGSGGGQPATYSLTNGLNTCAGSQDQLTNPCNGGNPNKNCQQDFHCDLTAGSPTINTCVWNQKTAYKDASCNGVDLTIGAGCDRPGPPAVYVLPICNRGTKTLPAGSVIKVGQTNTGGFNSWNSNCAGGTGVTCSDTLTAPLGPGQCYNMTTCPGGNGQRWEIVNADNSIVECGAPGAGCANNASQVKDNGSGCQNCTCLSGTAELTGKILDPAKLRPVYGATVYIPSTPVGALPGPNVQCDTCANIYQGLPARASATTEVDGTFRLQGVPAGVAFPLVIQLGRFRRQLSIAPIAACGTAALTAAQGHLPGTKTKVGDTAADTANPDLPLIAIVTGAGDATECLLARMGIATSEFTAPGAGGSVEMYGYKRVNGLSGATGAFGGKGATIAGIGDADALLGTAATLNKYNALVLPCHNTAGGSAPTATMQTNLQAWLDAGGRLFSSHVPVEDFIHKPVGNPNDGVATWSQASQWGNNPPDSTDRASNGNALTDNINLGFPKGTAMAQWIQLSWAAPGGPGGAPPAYGKLPLPDYRHDVASVAANTTSWLSGASTGGNSGAGVTQHNILSFDAPRANAPAAQCGRAVLPFMHVSSTSSGTFPAECGSVPGALTGQELSFEYMMWETLTCLAPSTAPPVAPPPTPLPPPAPLVSVTFTRDYQAVCPIGTRVDWKFFYWQAVIPGGTNIAFRAATADTSAMLPAAPPGAAPTTVSIGNATTSVVAPSWAQDARTVADHLYNDPPGPGVKSKEFLRVYMTFNPSGGAAPLLQSWRQTYDCVPAE